jgi:acetolactate synthase regulatory subunit
MRPRTRAALLAIGLAAATVTACSGGDQDAGGAEAATVPAADAPTEGEVAAPPAVEGTPIETARSLIQRADLALRVDDVDGTVDRAVQLTEERGGFLSGQELTRTADGATGSVQLHVPAPRFRDLLDQLSALGELVDRHVSTDDVTGEVVDLHARLATAQASVARVRDLLAAASGVDEVVRLEAEVSSRETVVEQLAGQLQVLEGQVAMSVIDLRLNEVVPEAPSAAPRPDEDIPGFGSGLDHGWVAFQDVVGVVLTVVGALLPFALAAAPVVLVVRFVRRRRRGAGSAPRPEPI